MAFSMICFHSGHWRTSTDGKKDGHIIMSKLFSLVGFGGGDDFGPEDLDAARDLITRVSQDDRGEFIPLLLKAIKKHPDIAAAFAWLHVHERRHADDNDAMVMLAALLDGPMFSPAQRQRSAKVAAGELEKSLRDKNIPDDIKTLILPLLAMAGRPVDDAMASRFFQDYDGAMQRHSLEFAKGLSDSPGSLTKMLLAQGIISDAEGAADAPVSREAASELLTFGQRVAQINPAGATLMTAALISRVGAPDFSHEHSPCQLDDIHALATPRARWCLETLANWPGFAIPFRDKAARLAADLANREIKCQAPLAPGEFSHGLVSMIDGMGSRTATLFHRTPKGGLDAFNVMLNDEAGVKDAYAFFENGSEVEQMFRSNPQQMSMANASLPLLRELLADTLALHEELGTAPPGSLFPLMAYYGNDPVKPRRREPNLGAYMLEAVRPTPELVAKGAELADNALFGCLFPASGAAYAFCEQHWDKRKKSLREADFPAFLQEIMPLERERLLQRMAVNLEVEALAGRAGRKENKTAARLWLGMRENVAPLWTIPFVRELANSAIDAIAEDLRHGFKNQRDAFAAEGVAAPDQEAALTGMLRQLFGNADLSDFPPPEFMEMLPGPKSKPRGKAKAKKKAAKGGWVME